MEELYLDVKIKGVKVGTNTLVPVSVDENGNIYVIICGINGTDVVPIAVDEDGKIILST